MTYGAEAYGGTPRPPSPPYPPPGRPRGRGATVDAAWTGAWAAALRRRPAVHTGRPAAGPEVGPPGRGHRPGGGDGEPEDPAPDTPRMRQALPRGAAEVRPAPTGRPAARSTANRPPHSGARPRREPPGARPAAAPHATFPRPAAATATALVRALLPAGRPAGPFTRTEASPR